MSLEIYEPCCIECGRSMGKMDYDELSSLDDCSSGSGCLCFDCEPLGARLEPDIFWNMIDGDIVSIDGLRFECIKGVLRSVAVEVSHAHALGARACLSSSTYLNRTIKNRSLLSSGEEVSTCCRCLYAKKIEGVHGPIECPSCLGVGIQVESIVIPVWVLGLEQDYG